MPRAYETLLATIRARCPDAETAMIQRVTATLQVLLPRFRGITVTETGANATEGPMIVWFGRLVAVTPLIATLSLLATTVTAWAVDEIFLTTGARITGDLQDDSLTLRAPHTSYRISRDTVWRIVLGGGGIGDTAELRNGNRLSGVVEQARY